MGLLLMIVFGGIVGWLASMLMGASEGIFGNIILGIIGAIIGGFIMNAFGQVGVTGFNLYSLFVAILGSIILLWLYRMVAHRRI